MSQLLSDAPLLRLVCDARGLGCLPREFTGLLLAMLATEEAFDRLLARLFLLGFSNGRYVALDRVASSTTGAVRSGGSK